MRSRLIASPEIIEYVPDENHPLNCLKLLYTAIVMDIGDSLNPAIDIGQIEGAFIQVLQ